MYRYVHKTSRTRYYVTAKLNLSYKSPSEFHAYKEQLKTCSCLTYKGLHT